MQKPPPPRPRPQSNDDLEQVKALELAEERARAALRLAEQESAQKAELERKVAELEADKDKRHAAELQRQLDTIVKATQAQPQVALTKEEKRNVSGFLTVQARGLKVGVPLAILVPVLAAGWAAVQQYLELQRQVKTLITMSATKDTRLDELGTRVNDQAAKIAELRETQAQLSGFLTGVLPKAGVNVPGTGSPILSDPLPLGARRPTPVNVRTPVPAPPPK